MTKPRPFSLTTGTFRVLSVFIFVHDMERKDIARWTPKIIAPQLFKPSTDLFISEFLSELLTVRLFRFIILSHLCFMKIYYKESKFLQRWWKKKKKGTTWSQESKDSGIGKKRAEDKQDVWLRAQWREAIRTTHKHVWTPKSPVCLAGVSVPFLHFFVPSTVGRGVF